LAILGLGRKKKAVEEVAPEPEPIKIRSGPALMLLIPEVAGGTSFRALPFDDAEDATAHLTTMLPQAVPQVHAFWAMMEKPGAASNGGEATVLIRAETGGDLVYVVSFVDIESALAFARFEVKRGMYLGHLMIYWAEMVTIEMTEEGIFLSPEIAPSATAVPVFQQPTAPIPDALVATEPQTVDPQAGLAAHDTIEEPTPIREGGATTTWVKRSAPDAAESVQGSGASASPPQIEQEAEELPFSLNPEGVTSPPPETFEAPAESALGEPEERPFSLNPTVDSVAPLPAQTAPEEPAVENPLHSLATEPEGDDAPIEFADDPDETLPTWVEEQIEKREAAPRAESSETEFPLEPEIAVEATPEEVAAAELEAQPIAEAPEPDFAPEPELAVEPDHTSSPETVTWADPEPEARVETVEPDAPSTESIAPEPVGDTDAEPAAHEPELDVQAEAVEPGALSTEEIETAPIDGAATIDVALAPADPEAEIEAETAGLEAASARVVEPVDPSESEPELTVVAAEEVDLEADTEAAEDEPEAAKAIDIEIDDSVELDGDDVEVLPTTTDETEIELEAELDPGPLAVESPALEIEVTLDDSVELDDEPIDAPAATIEPQDRTAAPSELENLDEEEQEPEAPVEAEPIEDIEPQVVEEPEPEPVAATIESSSEDQASEEAPAPGITFDEEIPIEAEAPSFLREDGRDEPATEWPEEPLSPQAQYEIPTDEDDGHVEEQPASEFEVTLEGPIEIPAEEAVTVSSNGASSNGVHDEVDDEPPETIPGEEDLSPEMAAFLKSRRRVTKDNPFRGFDSPPGRF
jgi:hypothetical protein